MSDDILLCHPNTLDPAFAEFEIYNSQNICLEYMEKNC